MLVKNESSERSARALKQAREKGSSSWLTVLPLKTYGFTLNKGEFRDSLLLRYDKDLPRLPQSCVCGAKMDINHALNCPRGGYIIIRHSSVRDFIANQISTVYKDVECEPTLQTLDGETFSANATLQETMLTLTSVPRDFIGRDRTPTSTFNFSIPILSLISHHQRKKYTRELRLRSGGYITR